MYADLVKQKTKCKESLYHQPCIKGEGGTHFFDLVERKLPHKQRGLTLSYGGQPWKSTYGQQKCPTHFGFTNNWNNMEVSKDASIIVIKVCA
jgi:hypothetical protein